MGMSKYQEAWERINSVLNSNLLFSEWLENKSNWGSYLNETNEVGAELKFDDDMNVIQKLIDERIEFESRKDKLIVGSEWECILENYSMYYEPFIIRIGNKFKIKTIYYEGTMEISNQSFPKGAYLPTQQFLHCFKPSEKGE